MIGKAQRRDNTAIEATAALDAELDLAPPRPAYADFLVHRILAPGVFGALVIALWQVATSVFSIETWLLPSPLDIINTFGSNWELLRDNTIPTLEETVVGFGFAVGFAVVLAVLIDYSRLLESALYPWLIAS